MDEVLLKVDISIQTGKVMLGGAIKQRGNPISQKQQSTKEKQEFCMKTNKYNNW